MNTTDDKLLNGAEAIGREAGFVNGDGKVDLAKTYYALERGYLPASKRGRIWISTRNRIRGIYTGGAAHVEAAG
jgi:hypothetical protein